MLHRVILIISVLAVFAGADLLAATLATEDFESYSIGASVNNTLNGGMGWNGAWNDIGGGTPTIQSGGLNYSNGQITINGGNRAMHITGLGAGATLPLERPVNALGSVAYMSFLYNNTVNAADADDFFQLGFDPVGGNNPDVSAIDENGNFRVRIGTGTSIDTGIASTTDETFFVVLRLEDTGGAAGYDRADLFINPDSLDEGSNTIDATRGPNIESGLDLIANSGILLFRTARLETGDEFVLDEFRIGTTFQSVLPQELFVPEPASLMTWSMLAMVGAAFGWRQFRKRVKAQ